jgi:RNA polymerase sigma-70 factor (ECF subfamily)
MLRLKARLSLCARTAQAARADRRNGVFMSAEKEHAQLLTEVQSGDQASMGRLAALVWERLYPFVFRTTLNHDVTEDVLQETLLSLLCRIGSLRDPARFWPWVYRIAWNKIRDTHRQHRRRSSVERTFLHAAIHGGEQRAVKDSVLDVKVREETLEQVATAVARLSQEHQDVVRLRYYDQLPYSDIASQTRTTPQRVRVQFHRAKKSLQARLQTCCT